MISAKRVLITGAAGFVGHRLTRMLAEKGYLVRALVRDTDQNLDSDNIEFIEVPDIASCENWDNLVQDCHAVIHLAARVHRMVDDALDPEEAYTRVNTTATARIAAAAARAGVKRFIFLSSIKACGKQEGKLSSQADDHYALSKAAAEKKLQDISSESGLEYVIVQPPLVYGPGVKANFRRLIELVAGGVPMPLASVNNKRSFIGLGNLADFIVLVLEHPAAVNKTYSVADGEDLSTSELVRKIAAKLGRPARLFPFPVKLLRFICLIIGKEGACQRLTSSLQVDCSAAKKELGWHPKNSFDQELEDTIKYYLDNRRGND